MKAAFLESTKNLIIKEIPVPLISDDEVLVKIKEVGLCGSDLHYYNEGRLNKRVVEKPVILGHESSGIIEKVGKNINHLKNGDRVAIEPGIPCCKCEYCKKGN